MRSDQIFVVTSLLAAWLGGCAASRPAAIRLVVAPAQMTRLAPNVVQPILDAHTTAVHNFDGDEQHGNERVAKARAALAAAQAEPAGATPEVHRAKIDRANAELEWQLVLHDEMAWRRASEQSTFERDKAALVYHTGGDIDLDAYQRQCNNARAALRTQDEKQIAARTRFERADQHLNVAKSHYVAAINADAKTNAEAKP